ncbi:Wadjet anti-phage system protein JetD domain-containing protein [Arsukibacterium sp.]|uniref:DUF7281 domain-containing protein n=1 Tax=Arsukibacterium sp. TaxID=1977258 RepID=UPI001BD479C0|nr:Wadjet anti-phage system protein JetD domain-containing protein [Arsukibacterium sp.]
MNYPPLSAKTLHWLQQLQQRLNASGSERVKTSVKAVQQVLAWCIEHELVPGNSLNLPHYTFSLALLKDIANVQRNLQQACFLDDLNQNSRLSNATISQQELKSIGQQPRQNRVLLKLSTTVDTRIGIAADIIDIDWQQLPLAQFDALLVVENLDCFYQLESFSIELPYQQPLIIYRGDTQYSSGAKALSSAWNNTGKPSIYFGDADLAGLSIALSLQCQSMLLPAINEFTQHASPAMLNDKQLKYQQRLQHIEITPAFSPYQQLICQQLKGLRQQNMQGMALATVPLISFW